MPCDPNLRGEIAQMIVFYPGRTLDLGHSPDACAVWLEDIDAHKHAIMFKRRLEDGLIMASLQQGARGRERCG